MVSTIPPDSLSRVGQNALNGEMSKDALNEDMSMVLAGYLDGETDITGDRADWTALSEATWEFPEMSDIPGRSGSRLPVGL